MEAIAKDIIEKRRVEEIANIENKRKNALKKLETKYKTADQIKISFGYIGIASLIILFGTIILNDMAKLLNTVSQRYLENKEDLRVKEERRKWRKRKTQVQIEIDENYSNDLSQKLETFYEKLIKSVALNRSRNTNY